MPAIPGVSMGNNRRFIVCDVTSGAKCGVANVAFYNTPTIIKSFFYNIYLFHPILTYVTRIKDAIKVVEAESPWIT